MGRKSSFASIQESEHPWSAPLARSLRRTELKRDIESMAVEICVVESPPIVFLENVCCTECALAWFCRMR